MTNATKSQKPPSPYRRGEAHLPNPSVNRARRPRILLKRIRAIERRLRDGRLSPRLTATLNDKLDNYRGELEKTKK